MKTLLEILFTRRLNMFDAIVIAFCGLLLRSELYAASIGVLFLGILISVAGELISDKC